MCRKRGAFRDDGFTVTEALVASAILMIAVVAVLQVFSFASASTAMNSTRERATNLANQRLEQARNLPYDSVGVAGGDPIGSLPAEEIVDDLTVLTDVSWARDATSGRATYKHVEVTVAWDEPRHGQVSVTSNVYGSSSLVNTGDAVVDIIEADTGDGMHDIAVTLTPASAAARTVRTDDTGEAFFGFVPTGAVTIGVVQPVGYIVDLSPLAGAEVTADTLTRLALFAQRPSSATVCVVTPSGGVVSGATVTLTDGASHSRTGTTGVDGRVRFGDLFKGTYSIAVSAANRLPGSGSITISHGGEDASCDISISDPAQLRVVVKDASGTAIQGATVQVTNPSGGTSTATTASSGEAGFTVTVLGTYTVVVTKTGYLTGTGSANVAASGASIDVVLGTNTPGSLRIVSYYQNNQSRLRGNVGVTVTNAAGTYSLSSSTNSSGVLIITGLVPGSYSVKVTGGSTYTTTVPSGGQAALLVYK